MVAMPLAMDAFRLVMLSHPTHLFYRIAPVVPLGYLFLVWLEYEFFTPGTHKCVLFNTLRASRDGRVVCTVMHLDRMFHGLITNTL